MSSAGEFSAVTFNNTHNVLSYNGHKTTKMYYGDTLLYDSDLTQDVFTVIDYVTFKVISGAGSYRYSWSNEKSQFSYSTSNDGVTWSAWSTPALSGTIVLYTIYVRWKGNLLPQYYDSPGVGIDSHPAANPIFPVIAYNSTQRTQCLLSGNAASLFLGPGDTLYDWMAENALSMAFANPSKDAYYSTIVGVAGLRVPRHSNGINSCYFLFRGHNPVSNITPVILPKGNLAIWAGADNIKFPYIQIASATTNARFQGLFYKLSFLSYGAYFSFTSGNIDKSINNLIDAYNNDVRSQYLNLIPIGIEFRHLSASFSLTWLNNVAPTGVLMCKDPPATFTPSPSTCPEGWTLCDYKYLVFRVTDAEDNGSSVGQVSCTMKIVYTRANHAMFYSIGSPGRDDGGSVNGYPIGNSKLTYIASGSTITWTGDLYVRGINTDGTGLAGLFTSNSSSNAWTCTTTGHVHCIGDIRMLSLYSGNIATLPTEYTSYAYAYMYYNNTALRYAPYIDGASTLGYICFGDMFGGCTALLTPPCLSYLTLATGCYARMFKGCTALVSAPALPAVQMQESCYVYMFMDCTALVNAPALPADKLAPYCYVGMFMNCSSLSNAPALKATVLDESCYSDMFVSCTSLKVAPDLPATTLAPNCYSYMFYYCNALTEAPELPATILAETCYADMFNNCTSLVNPPVLPSTSLEMDCYTFMFRDCTSMLYAPELPATTLKSGCYSSMFRGCTSLVVAPYLPATTLVRGCYTSMFTSCSSLKLLHFEADPTALGEQTSRYWVDYSGVNTALCKGSLIGSGFAWGGNTLPSGTQVSYTPHILAFYRPASSAAATVYPKFTASGVSMQYSTTFPVRDETTWTSCTNSQAITVPAGTNYIYFRGAHDSSAASPVGLFTSNNINNQWMLPGFKAVSGSIMSLLTTGYDGMYAYHTALASYAFTMMFNKSELVNAPSLIHATTLGAVCYSSMFTNCASLIHAPTLPATTLAGTCYNTMFSDCTSLKTAPRLPATTTTSACYANMFYNCTSLKKAPELPASVIASNCYSAMFYGCTSLRKAPELPGIYVSYNAYREMFRKCSSLVKAPSQLPATTVESESYYGMFRECTALVQAPVIRSQNTMMYSHSYMFYGCTALRTVHLVYAVAEATYMTDWLTGTYASGTLYKAGTQFTASGTNTYPSGWTQVQWDGV
jgi:hypothetical protein